MEIDPNGKTFRFVLFCFSLIYTFNFDLINTILDAWYDNMSIAIRFS